MSEAKTFDGYPCKPRTLPGNAWFYTERKGICVVIGINQTTISWRKVEAALRHHQVAKRTRAHLREGE